MISSMDEAHPAIQAESCAMEGVAAKIFASEANAMPVARGALPIPFLRPMIILLVFWRCHDRQRGNARAKILRSEEHTSELQSLMRISYAVFCLKKKKQQNNKTNKVSTNYNK